MRRFKWINWNLGKIAAHALSPEEVEGAFDRATTLTERDDGSFKMLATIPSGRRIWVPGRYDTEEDDARDIFAELDDVAIFVITAY